MTEVLAGFLAPCQQNYFVCRVENFSKGKWQVKLKKPELQCHANFKSKSQKYLVRNELTVKPATYSARISTNIPLYEAPGVPTNSFLSQLFSFFVRWVLIFIGECGVEQALFDQYLEDKPRIFNAMFPDKHRSQQLNQVFAFLLFIFLFHYLFSYWCWVELSWVDFMVVLSNS